MFCNGRELACLRGRRTYVGRFREKTKISKNMTFVLGAVKKIETLHTLVTLRKITNTKLEQPLFHHTAESGESAPPKTRKLAYIYTHARTHTENINSYKRTHIAHLSFITAESAASASAARSLSRPASRAETCPSAASRRAVTSPLAAAKAACSEAWPDNQPLSAGLRKLSRSYDWVLRVRHTPRGHT